SPDIARPRRRGNRAKRRASITLLGGAATTWPLGAPSPEPSGRGRSYGLAGSPATVRTTQARAAAGRAGNHNKVWARGRYIRVDHRWAGTDLEAMGRSAVELVAMNPYGILSANTPTTAALLQQTRTIPIIFATVGDPTGSGFVESFSRPGGNVTGFTTLEG